MKFNKDRPSDGWAKESAGKQPLAPALLPKHLLKTYICASLFFLLLCILVATHFAWSPHEHEREPYFGVCTGAFFFVGGLFYFCLFSLQKKDRVVFHEDGIEMVSYGASQLILYPQVDNLFCDSSRRIIIVQWSDKRRIVGCSLLSNEEWSKLVSELNNRLGDRSVIE